MRANTNTVKIEEWNWWEIGAKYNDCDRSWIAIKRIHFFVYRTIEIVVIQNCYRGQKNYYRYCPRRWRVLERFWSSFLRNRNYWLLVRNREDASKAIQALTLEGGMARGVNNVQIKAATILCRHVVEEFRGRFRGGNKSANQLKFMQPVF